jgi:hypothetical protein
MDLRLKGWLQEVFGGTFRAVYFWVTAATVFVTWALRYVPGYHLPRYATLIPACAFAIGFVCSNVTAFSRAVIRAEDAERKLAGLWVEIESVTAGEHLRTKESLYEGPPHHSVVIELRLVARNRDGQNACSIELLGCDANLSDGQPATLYFLPEIDQTSINRDPRRLIPSGDMKTLTVMAIYNLALTETHIEQGSVVGTLRLSDNRGTKFNVPFSSSLIKNPIHTE